MIPLRIRLLKEDHSSTTTPKNALIRSGCAFVLGVLILLSTRPPLLADVGFSQAVYDRSGTLLRLTLAKDEKYRLFLPLHRISPILQEAVMLHEDQFFYQHPGVNPASLARAFIQTYLSSGRRVGASTLSMQLARLKFDLSTRNIPGKLWQIAHAIQIELHYSKQEILEAYLNLAPYGYNIEGVGAASLIYFKRPAFELTLPEAMTLAVIPQSPTRRAPKSNNPNYAPLLEARNRLFTRWLEVHPESTPHKHLFSLPLKTYSPKELPFLAPHQVLSLLAAYPHETEITSTIHIQTQKLLEKMLNNYVTSLHSIGVNNGAAMLVNYRTMEVVAALGSSNFLDASILGQVDGTKARRSPGSALKPFIYAMAFDQGLIHPMTLLKDSPTQFGDYNPENYDRDFNGPISARNALMLSRNIPALTLAAKLKKPSFYQFLQQAGIQKLRDNDDYGLSLVLGGGEVTMRELVKLYAMLANGGTFNSLVEVATHRPLITKPMIGPEASFMALDALRETPRPQMRVGGPDVYWKTGTSNAFRDAWTAGVFGEYVLVVWIGNFNGKSNPAFVGVKAAAPLFFQMVDALAKQTTQTNLIASKPQQLPKLRQVHVCTLTGDIADELCPITAKTWFIPGVSPIKRGNIYRKILVDSKTGLRACQAVAGKTQWRVAEFWPSDLLETFRRAGIIKAKPPAFMPECANRSTVETNRDDAPQITSPNDKLVYHVRVNASQKDKIPLAAITDGDTNELFWFADNHFLGKSKPEGNLIWEPAPGEYTIRAVDAKGRSDSIKVRVAVTPN